jgi:hypothetical protein
MSAAGGGPALLHYHHHQYPEPSFFAYDEKGDDLTLFAKENAERAGLPPKQTYPDLYPARTGSGTGARTVAYTYPPPIPAVYFVGRNGVVQTRIRKTGVLLHTHLNRTIRTHDLNRVGAYLLQYVVA